MNSTQRQVLGWGLAVFLGMAIFPPWVDDSAVYHVTLQSDLYYASGNPRKDVGDIGQIPWSNITGAKISTPATSGRVEYAFLLDPPSGKGGISRERLIMQWFVLAVTVAVGCALAKKPNT